MHQESMLQGFVLMLCHSYITLGRMSFHTIQLYNLSIFLMPLKWVEVGKMSYLSEMNMAQPLVDVYGK